MSKNYARLGDFNVICDVCGFKFKRSQVRMRWDRLMVCSKDWEIRNPQDYLESRPERQRIEDARPRPTDVFNNHTNRSPDDL